jgi:hypothetical protein
MRRAQDLARPVRHRPGCLYHYHDRHRNLLAEGVPAMTTLRSDLCADRCNQLPPAEAGRSEPESARTVPTGPAQVKLVRCCSLSSNHGPDRTPTFRFSGLRIAMQDYARRSTCLLSEPRYTPIDVRVRGYMRLGMRLLRPTLLGCC